MKTNRKAAVSSDARLSSNSEPPGCPTSEPGGRANHDRGLSAERCGRSWGPKWLGGRSNTRWRPIARLVIMRNSRCLAVMVLGLGRSVLAGGNSRDYAVLVSEGVYAS